ncbi:hypothetical protein KUCAC02_021605, partial [Chaenocephalus aceratus]
EAAFPQHCTEQGLSEATFTMRITDLGCQYRGIKRPADQFKSANQIPFAVTETPAEHVSSHREQSAW